jgi:hypothetical protein
MHDFHIRDSDIRVGYAFPTGPGLPHSGVLASQRGNETQDYRGEMNVLGIRTPLLRRPLLLPRGEALDIPASLPSEECAQI